MSEQRTSSIPQVLDALDDNFTAALATAAWDGGQLPVTQGTFVEPQRESVEIGDVIGDDQQAWASLGDRQRSEDYIIAGWIEVNLPGQDVTQRQAKDRAFAILAICETTLRDDVYGGLQASGQFRHLEMQMQTVGTHGEPTESGYLFQIAFGVRIKARI